MRCPRPFFVFYFGYPIDFVDLICKYNYIALMKSKQLQFFERQSQEHGGETRIDKRKIIRPLTHTRPIHVVMRSSLARKELSLLNFAKKIDRLLAEKARKFGITIYEKANSGNHLHLLIRGKKRADIQQFFRAITGRIARIVTGARKGKPFGKFWDHLIYTRILNSWRREFHGVKGYVVRNTLETLGLIPYKPRKLKKNTS